MQNYDPVSRRRAASNDPHENVEVEKKKKYKITAPHNLPKPSTLSKMDHEALEEQKELRNRYKAIKTIVTDENIETSD